jgi:hypothetical protein
MNHFQAALVIQLDELESPRLAVIEFATETPLVAPHDLTLPHVREPRPIPTTRRPRGTVDEAYSYRWSDGAGIR